MLGCAYHRMRNTSDIRQRYRGDLLIWRANQLGLNYQAVSRIIAAQPNDLIVNGATVKRIFSGANATFDTVWAIADALNIDRHAMTDFKLKERDFSRAVVNGKAAR